MNHITSKCKYCQGLGYKDENKPDIPCDECFGTGHRDLTYEREDARFQAFLAVALTILVLILMPLVLYLVDADSMSLLGGIIALYLFTLPYPIWLSSKNLSRLRLINKEYQLTKLSIEYQQMDKQKNRLFEDDEIDEIASLQSLYENKQRKD